MMRIFGLFALQLSFALGNRGLSLFNDTKLAATLINDGVPGVSTDRLASSPGAYAYVTSVYDDTTCGATRVMLFSIKQTRTVADVVVLTLKDRLGFSCRSDLAALGAIIKRVDPVVHPSGLDRPYNQHLRYTKLLAWGLTSYKKLVLMDSDMIVLKNIDHLFLHATPAAVEDAGAPGLFNSGLMVITPNNDTLHKMLSQVTSAPSYNGGDQGFLNWFYKGWSRRLNLHLPVTYNVFPRLRKFASWALYKDKVKVLHYTAEVKPWTFFSKHHPTWITEFDPYLAWLWVEKRELMETTLKRQAMEPRTRRLCRAGRPRKRNPNMFTLQINTFNSETTVNLLVNHYCKLPSLTAIYIIWHDPSSQPKNRTRCRVPVQYTLQVDDTLNNRFLPSYSISTQLVLSIDDDSWVEDLQDVEFAFQVARLHPHRLVGFFPRVHFRNGTRLEYQIALPKDERGFRRYSVMLTKFLFLNTDYLFMYSCLLPENVRRYVTSQRNCEDILMNWMVSGLSGEPPMAVYPHRRIFDTGTMSDVSPGRISLQAGHLDTRTDCLNDFELALGNCTLQYNDFVASNFVKVPFHKARLEEVLPEIRKTNSIV